MPVWKKYPIIMRALVICIFTFIVIAFGLHELAHAKRGRKNRYHGAFAVNSPMAITSDGVERLFVVVPDAIEIFGLKGKPLGIINGAWEGVIVEPSDIAFYKDRLYITDAWVGHIVVLDMDGNILDTYGRRGTGAKEFIEPSGIFVQEGLIYISDKDNARVQVLSLDGVFLGYVGDQGKPLFKLRAPSDLVVDDRGVIYVVDEPEQWVKLYYQAGQYINKLTHMRKPMSMTLSGDGVAVADMSSGIVRRYGLNLRTRGERGAWGMGVKELTESSGMTTAGKYIYVSDPINNEIKRFSLFEGGFPPPVDGIVPRPYAVVQDMIDVLPHWPGKLMQAPDGSGGLYMQDLKEGGMVRIAGKDMGEAVTLAQCTLASFALGKEGRIFCLDSEAGKVVVLTDSGQMIREFYLEQPKLGGAVGDPVDIAVASDGTLLVADSRRGKILLYNAEGQYTGVLGRGGTDFYIKEPVAIYIDKNDIVYICDAESRTILIYSLNGRLLRSIWDNKKLSKPASVSVSNNYVFVLDIEGPNIKVFSKNGKMLFSFGAEGAGNGDFYIPSSLIALSDNKIIVSDTGNGRLQVFSIAPLKWQRPNVRMKSNKELKKERREKLKKELEKAF